MCGRSLVHGCGEEGRRCRLSRALAVSIVLLVGAASSVSAGPADLDRTFGNGGSAIVPFPDVESLAEAVVVQPDGKIVAAGAAGLDFGLARLHPDGSLDASFGVGGLVITDFGDTEIAHAMVLQPDGKLVVAGETFSGTTALALARYQADGTLDPDFGVGGLVRMPELSARSLVLQPDGMLVVGGFGTHGFTLVRYDAAGVLDPTFGAGGVAATDFPDTKEGLRLLSFGLALQPDRKIVAVGGGGFLIALARFTADGTLDATFGTGGRVATDLSPVVSLPPGFLYPFSRAYRVRVLADGKLVLAAVSTIKVDSGVFGVAAPGVALVLRYSGDGTLDPTFNSTGIVVLNDPAQQLADARGLIVQPDGSLVAIGWSYFRKRIGSDGTTDPSFSSADMPSGGAINLVAQPDGKLVAVGYAVSGPAPTFEIVRFGNRCGDGSLDPASSATTATSCPATAATPTARRRAAATASSPLASSATRVRAPPAVPRRARSRAPVPNACHPTGRSAACRSAMPPARALDLLVPNPICVAPTAGASRLSMSRLSDAHRRSLSWTWKGGPIDTADLVAPMTTPYALCVYDHSGGAARLAARVPIGNPLCPTCWTSSAQGHRYHQRIGASGSTHLVLHASGDSVGAFQVKASAEFVAPTTTLPMSADPKVTAQLRNAVGGCWGADYMTPLRDDSERFTAKSN